MVGECEGTVWVRTQPPRKMQGKKQGLQHGLCPIQWHGKVIGPDYDEMIVRMHCHWECVNFCCLPTCISPHATSPSLPHGDPGFLPYIFSTAWYSAPGGIPAIDTWHILFAKAIFMVDHIVLVRV